MDDFRGYIISGDSSVFPTVRQLERIVERYPWFTTARVMLCWKSGASDALVGLSLTGKPLPRVFHKSVTARATTGTLGVIDQFLETGEHRISPDGSANDDEDLSARSATVPEDELSEDLAKIYLSQGHLRLAGEVYDKLFLLYPKKSVYFAQIIADIDRRLAAGEGAGDMADEQKEI